ncbi:MAG: hypothetical protein Ta2B_19740 [Termitinemataceae bacterium]|nr:MAG: hypothetical protein Ta2B_19740 [Termitinemataceae bacterium]
MKYIMSDKEIGRLTLIKGAIDGVYTVGYVAKRLSISTRRVKTLKKAVREHGDGAVIHGNSGRHPKNYTDDEIRKRIILIQISLIFENWKILNNAGIVSKKSIQTVVKNLRDESVGANLASCFKLMRHRSKRTLITGHLLNTFQPIPLKKFYLADGKKNPPSLAGGG